VLLLFVYDVFLTPQLLPITRQVSGRL